MGDAFWANTQVRPYTYCEAARADERNVIRRMHPH